MMIFSYLKKAILNSKNQRILTIAGWAGFALTADECAPWGDDSCPLPNWTALYAETSNNGDRVVIGYINNNQLAGPGEKRFYSLKPDKSIGFYLWLKNDGTLEIGGNGNHAVRYEPLNIGLQALVTKINTELGKISTGLGGVGGVYTVAPVRLDINASKVNEVKIL